MEAVIKRKKQRLVKVLTRLYCILMSIAIVEFVGVILMLTFSLEKYAQAHPNLFIAYLISLIFSITAAAIIGAVAQGIGLDLIRYKCKIKRYRAYNHFNIIVKLMENKEYSKAIDLYNSMNNGGVKDSLYPYMLGVLANCDDPIRVKNANKNIEKMLNQFNPDTVFN